jgi:hypothetical protein
VTELWATLITDYRLGVPCYTVLDQWRQISVITTNRSIAQRYLDLCARGLSSQQILQLDHYRDKAPVRKKGR